MKQDQIWKASIGDGPLVATAIHSGHQLRDEISRAIAISEEVRLREEDPFTEEWTRIGDTSIIGLRSRFEVDLNRPREKAVYRQPEDSWGLDVFGGRLSSEIIDRSLSEYDHFYAELRNILTLLQKRFGYIVIFDLHSYNHRRDGKDAPPADQDGNPEVNIGTGSMDRSLWAPLLDHFIKDLQTFDYHPHRLDVRENIRFKGGELSRWVHREFSDSICSISIEFKKFFMDEWSGEPDRSQIDNILQALESTIPGVREELKRLGATI